jgi:hypothetical protein
MLMRSVWPLRRKPIVRTRTEYYNTYNSEMNHIIVFLYPMFSYGICHDFAPNCPDSYSGSYFIILNACTCRSVLRQKYDSVGKLNECWTRLRNWCKRLDQGSGWGSCCHEFHIWQIQDRIDCFAHICKKPDSMHMYIYYLFIRHYLRNESLNCLRLGSLIKQCSCLFLQLLEIKV